ncbi:MAG: peptidase M22 [Ruminococcaceae bacterium]|nr:peptidase M22 [Oscillospiraceae bacterium]
MNGTKRIVIAIDTSNYTTSVSLMYEDGEVIANIKRPLSVKEGERGLRQSDAVFSHIKNLPSAMNEAGEHLAGSIPSAVGVSTRPRNIDGSYMPCFLSGVAAAESIGASLGIPVYKYSHQCGHIMAAIYSSGRFDLLDGREFCAFHVSGGTTEVLKVKYDNGSFISTLVGGSSDLNAGQAIDRIGVYMGLKFPAGAHMEKLALENTKKIPSKKPKIEGLNVNLSGLENISARLYDETRDQRLVSAFTLEYIAKALILLVDGFKNAYGEMPFIFSGGVMSNSIIKQRLKTVCDAYFAEPSMSADNAVGTAYLTVKEHFML